MTSPVTEDDEGKRVVDGSGDRIGTVTDVDFSVLQVTADGEPDVGDADAVRVVERDDDRVVYEVEKQHVESVTDDELRVGISS